jgi:glycolate oxidase FAD binding subunit
MDTALTSFADQIRAAAASATPLRIRGGGSKDFYGQSFVGDLLDTRVLRGVTSYEPSELVVTALAGTPLAELEHLLAEKAQYLPFEPPHFGPDATVGGMVAAGLSGPARMASGGVRDYVLGVQMLNGRAQALRFGGQVMKNVAGYDVSRLMAGSLGTLGLITEVSLKVLPKPVAEATICLPCDQAGALRQLNQWAGKPLPINASCWSQVDGRGRLFVRLRGAAAAVQSACQQLGGEQQGELQADAFWQSLREQTGSFFDCPDDLCLWRVSVPDTTGALMLADGDTLLEWGGGLRWVKAPSTQATALRAAVAAVGGTATLFRRARQGVLAETAVFHPLAPTVQRIHHELKRQFDPAGIFNRARMFAAF